VHQLRREQVNGNGGEADDGCRGECDGLECHAAKGIERRLNDS
jgi:hypothetical protein